MQWISVFFAPRRLALAIVFSVLALLIIGAEPVKSVWESSIAAFEADDQKSPPPADPILFVGSSTIRMWNLKKFLPELVALNRGFGGSAFSDLSFFFDRVVLPYNPSIAVVYSGDNDIASGKSPEQVATDYAAFHTKFRAAFPDTPLIFLAIKPSIQRWALYDKMKEANRRIAEQHKADARFTALDLGPLMLGEDGKPRAELFIKDGLHLSDAGYKLWSEELIPLIERLKAAPKGSETP